MLPSNSPPWLLMLFARLLNWLFPGRADRHRAIFRFWDGQKMRAIDPMVAFRALEEDPVFSLDKHPAMMDRADSEDTEIVKQANIAAKETVEAVRRVFGLKDFDHGGLLEAECLDLFTAFFDFLGSLKKSTDQPPISSAPTESGSSDPVPTPTSSSSDSGKTPNDPS